MKILITGGAGFIGSHCAEFYAKNGENDVVVYDNLSRAQLLNKDTKNFMYNWQYLKGYKNIRLVRGDIRDLELLNQESRDCDIIIHTAAQTAVTTSLTNPREDFSVNATGTFNILESARKNDVKTVIYCSTNKVYGNNINKVKSIDLRGRYMFEKKFESGIDKSFPIDLCEHTPYGCSKLAGDLYSQDYSLLYGIKTGVFRLSCIYGTRQFGVEDQGWLAWFTIATITGRPITIYGDGKQVRDVLYIDDLIKCYDEFVKSNLKYGVFNTGGGPKNTLSLVELLDILERLTGKRSKINFSEWRMSDQKVYISDISELKEKLNWEPKIGTEEGIKKLVDWVSKNRQIFVCLDINN